MDYNPDAQLLARAVAVSDRNSHAVAPSIGRCLVH